MKSQAAVVLVALFLLTALTTNADCFSGTVPGRTRQLEKKFVPLQNLLPEQFC